MESLMKQSQRGRVARCAAIWTFGAVVVLASLGCGQEEEVRAPVSGAVAIANGEPIFPSEVAHPGGASDVASRRDQLDAGVSLACGLGKPRIEQPAGSGRGAQSDNAARAGFRGSEFRLRFFNFT